MKKILVIDDEENMRHMLSVLLRQAGFNVSLAADGLIGLEAIKSMSFDAVLCDIKMPKKNGIELLEDLKKGKCQIPVVMMSAFGTVSLAVDAMKRGAADFVTKPFQGEEVVVCLHKVIQQHSKKSHTRNIQPKQSAPSLLTGFDRLIGKSDVLTEIIRKAKKIAQYKTTVLITGESGTGKELLAQGIHAASTRNNKPFVPVNCGSIPDNLLEAELFGHAKGAFTGADQARKGLFGEAEQGTLFLDEIGELPINLQVKLLRVLQEDEFRPLGSSKVQSVDTRIITATSRSLEHEILVGNFRKDLFFRLNVMHLEMPPLRNRQEDVLLLAHFFLDKVNKQTGTSIKGIDSEAGKLLESYHWPGNVRELQNIIERSALMSETSILQPEDLPTSIISDSPSPVENTLEETISIKQGHKILEKELITKALLQTNGNKSKAATLLEISYPSLLKKIKIYNI